MSSEESSSASAISEARGLREEAAAAVTDQSAAAEVALHEKAANAKLSGAEAGAETKAEAEAESEADDKEDKDDDDDDQDDEMVMFTQHPTEVLTDEEFSMLESLFKQMNVEGDGVLKPKELVEAMKKVGEEVDEDTIKRQLKMGDGAEEGLRLEDFIHTMAFQMAIKIVKMKRKKMSEDDVKLAFSSFDLNQDGFIDKEELGHAMENIGFQMEPEEIDGRR